MAERRNEVADVKKAIGEDLFKQLAKHFQNGFLCLADIARIPMTELENLHQLGRQHIVRKDYDKAEKVLEMLVHLYPYSSEFWGTYGICLQHREKFLKARTAYAVASERDKKKLEWYVYGAECELMLQNPKFALDLIKPVFHLKATGPRAVEMFKRAQRIKAVAESMESGPGDLPVVKKQIEERIKAEGKSKAKAKAR